MNNSDIVIGVTAALLISVVALFAAISHINQWERANNYPYGQMCNSIFTGWQNTCPVRR